MSLRQRLLSLLPTASVIFDGRRVAEFRGFQAKRRARDFAEGWVSGMRIQRIKHQSASIEAMLELARHRAEAGEPMKLN